MTIFTLVFSFPAFLLGFLYYLALAQEKEKSKTDGGKRLPSDLEGADLLIVDLGRADLQYAHLEGAVW